MTKRQNWVEYSFFVISILILGIVLFNQETDQSYILIGIITLIALIVLDIYTPKIANRKEDDPKVKAMRNLNRISIIFTVGLFIFLAWLPDLTELSYATQEWLQTAIAMVVMLVIGNIAPKLPFNRYMGLRLPWTIRDEATWEVAHKLIGYITIPLVIMMFLCCLFFNANQVIPIFIISWIAIPGVYSGWFYYQRATGRR